ncbi:hypothetical protein BVC80_8321g6 [Macleaya cordata]|uniref:Uncharacterized protein n=1 Tax=Macleaya cordata TaxID=56857 RepID=A0A200PYP8_MACCD|nr:hypothetical protein BVC80_8321g6 [Macleaya cordata]
MESLPLSGQTGGMINGDVEEWGLAFRHELRMEEQGWLNDPLQLNEDQEDDLKCSFVSAETYSVKECYEVMCREDGPQFPLKLIWKKFYSL